MSKEIKNIVAFMILMEGNEGFIGKSPGYILEKFQKYCLSDREDSWKWGLDFSNQKKLKEWAKKWLNEDINFGE